MTLPSPPNPISASQIRGELFDNDPVSLSEFQGDRVWNGSSFENLPSGQISYSNFRGRSYVYNVDVLLVGGGGGGGNGGGDGAGGGGGGGQLKILTGIEMRNTGETVSVVIGPGGGGATGTGNKGSTGGTTTFTGYDSAAGGGGGGSTNLKDGEAGCSGGGGAAEFGSSNPTGDGGVSNCVGGGGNAGGSGATNTNVNDRNTSGGGGGGYGADDLSPDSNATPGQAGWGRRGYPLDNFMGSTARIAAGLNDGVAGGGGGANAGSGSRGGGRDGGGQGAGTQQRLPDPGINGTGGGGGGGTRNFGNPFDPPGTANPDGASGGSGLVIVRYSKSNPGGQVGGGGNVYSDDNYYYHVFTSDGSYVM